MPANQDDLARAITRLIDKADIKVRETPEEVAARIEESKLAGAHNRAKDMLLTRAFLWFVGPLALLCAGLVSIPGAPVEGAKWASMTLTAILAAGAGYYAKGKADK